jgi:hypothetical protein
VLFRVYESDGNWYGHLQLGNSSDATATTFPFGRDSWHYLVITKNSGTRIVTVRMGQQIVATFRTDFTLGDGNYFDAMYLGCDPHSYGAGYINNVLVYDRELSEAEIAALVDRF